MKVSYYDTLVYYDGIQVFEARSWNGGHYVGLLDDSDAYHDRYLVTGVTPESLNQYRTGHRDLRSLMTETQDNEWFWLTTNGSFEEDLTVAPFDRVSILHSDILPDHGSLMYEVSIDDEPLLHRARSSGRLALELRLFLPTPDTEPRVRMAALGDLLSQMQAVIRDALNNALRGMTSAEKQNIPEDGHLMDVVVPASPGSFKVILESAAHQQDLLGDIAVERALNRLDDVFAHVSDPMTVTEEIKPYKGRLANSYTKLLGKLAGHGAGLAYSWATPRSTNTNRVAISGDTVERLARSLTRLDSTHERIVRLSGTLGMLDVSSGRWGLRTAEGVKRGVAEESGSFPGRLNILGEYTFECVEVHTIKATGQERRTLHLRRIHAGRRTPYAGPTI